MLLERLDVAARQRLQWRADSKPGAQVGANIDSDDLPIFPGPRSVTWRATPLI